MDLAYLFLTLGVILGLVIGQFLSLGFRKRPK